MTETQTPFIHPIALDPRPIQALADPASGRLVAAIGHFDFTPPVTQIRAYEEPGQMANVPFYAVYQGEHLQARIPGHLVMVLYADPTPQP